MKQKKKLMGEDDPPVANGAVRLSSLEQLESACTRQVVVPIRIFDQDIEVPMRLLLDNEREMVERILLEVVPPLKKAAGKVQEVAGGAPSSVVKPEYDLSDPAYQEKLRLHNKMARAVCLYLCVPMFANRFPDLKSREEILEAVSSCKLTEAVLNKLYAVALSEEQKVDELASFT